MATPELLVTAVISLGTTSPFSVSAALSKNLNLPPEIKLPSGLAALQVTATVVMGIFCIQ
jgi:hypothetical protein